MAGYTDSGVNFELGDKISEALYVASKQSWDNRKGKYGEMEELFPSFSGFRGTPMRFLGDTTHLIDNLNSDGVGTKIEVAERLEDHTSIAHDLFAMVLDDAAIRGCETIKINTVFSIRKLDDNETMWKAVSELCEGYVSAARAGDVVITNGELAELGNRIRGYGKINYDWVATAQWVAHKDRALSGAAVKPGDKLVGVREKGFRSNGFTDVRAAFKEKYGKEWHLQNIPRHGSLGRLVLQPSIIYSRALVDMSGGYDINRDPKAPFHAAAHITGGGVPEKLRRTLKPSGKGAIIDNPFPLPYVMELAQEAAGMPDEVAITKWNGGVGMIIITDEASVGATMNTLTAHGHVGRVIGEVTEDPTIRMRSEWADRNGEFLDFAA